MLNLFQTFAFFRHSAFHPALVELHECGLFACCKNSLISTHNQRQSSCRANSCRCQPSTSTSVVRNHIKSLLGHSVESMQLCGAGWLWLQTNLEISCSSQARAFPALVWGTSTFPIFQRRRSCYTTAAFWGSSSCKIMLIQPTANNELLLNPTSTTLFLFTNCWWLPSEWTTPPSPNASVPTMLIEHLWSSFITANCHAHAGENLEQWTALLSVQPPWPTLTKLRGDGLTFAPESRMMSTTFFPFPFSSPTSVATLATFAFSILRFTFCLFLSCLFTFHLCHLQWSLKLSLERILWRTGCVLWHHVLHKSELCSMMKLRHSQAPHSSLSKTLTARKLNLGGNGPGENCTAREISSP